MAIECGACKGTAARYLHHVDAVDWWVSNCAVQLSSASSSRAHRMAHDHVGPAVRALGRPAAAAGVHETVRGLAARMLIDAGQFPPPSRITAGTAIPAV